MPFKPNENCCRDVSLRCSRKPELQPWHVLKLVGGFIHFAFLWGLHDHFKGVGATNESNITIDNYG